MAAFPSPVPASLAESGAPSRGAARRWAAIALGTSLAPRGAMVKIALAIAALTVLGGLGAALTLASRGAGNALVQVSAATSTALAWGAGTLIAVPASLHAFREDRASGVRALLAARGASAATYAQGRVAGLALVLFAVVGGGTLMSGGAAFLLASRLGVAGHAFEELLGSLLYAAAFALVVAPLSLAALGARSRGGGYLVFLALLVLPEMIQPWTSALVPAGWGELLSVPSALGALRAALPAQALDLARLTRAAFVLAAFAALAFALVRGEIAALDGQEPEARA